MNRQPIVFVVDDDDAVRNSLRLLLKSAALPTTAFASAQEFLAAWSTDQPGCLVLDVRMPGMSGLELQEELNRRGAIIPVIFISGHADVPMAVAGLKAGAQDFIEKPVDDVKLVAAINRAISAKFERQAASQAAREAEQRFERLTPREVEVFDLVAQGLTSQAIAARLGISGRTVESYRAQIMEKLQMDSIASIVRRAVRLKRVSA